MNWINRCSETLSAQSTYNFYDQGQKTRIGRVTGNLNNVLHQTNSGVALLTCWTEKQQKLLTKTDHQFNTKV